MQRVSVFGSTEDLQNNNGFEVFLGYQPTIRDLLTTVFRNIDIPTGLLVIKDNYALTLASYGDQLSTGIYTMTPLRTCDSLFAVVT